MRIKSIAIDGMHNVSHKHYTFEDVNYIVGSNGAGKSTILQAIQLALLGYIPGYKHTNAAIFEHANGPTMSVTLELYDKECNYTIRRTWLKTKSSVTCTTVADPDNFNPEELLKNIELPIFNFSEFVNMTANNLKDWFIKFLPNSNSKVDWDNIMKEAKTKFPSSTVSSDIFCGFGTDISGVAQANTFIKGAMSSEKQQLDRDSSTIQSLIYYDDIDPNMNKSDLISKRDKLIDDIKYSVQCESIKTNNAKFKAMIDSCYSEIDSYSSELASMNVSELDSYDDTIAQHKVEIEKLDQQIDDLKADAANMWATRNEKSKIANSSGICPYTQLSCTSIQSTIDQYQKDILDIDQKYSKIRKNIEDKCNERNSFKSNLDEIEHKQRRSSTLQDKISVLEKKILALNQNMIPEQPFVSDVNELNLQLDKINNDISKLTANEEYSNLIDMLTKSKFEHENNIELLKHLVKVTGVNGIQSEMIDGPFMKFRHKLDKYIMLMFDKDTHPEFNLSQAANSFSFGLVRCGKYIPFAVLSSGEKCLYMIAIMTCICQSNTDIHTILIDDMLDHLDNSNIDVLFNVVTRIPEMQFIFAGVANYDGNINKIEVI